MTAARNREGFMAELQRLADGSFLMTEHHCPISDVVENCAQLCDAEVEIFRTALGPDAIVERVEHMPGGDRRCAYRIRRASAR